MKYVILHHQFFSYPIPKTSLQFSYTLHMVQDQKQINNLFMQNYGKREIARNSNVAMINTLNY